MINTETNHKKSQAGDEFVHKFEKISISDNLLILPNSFLQITNISKVSALEYKRPSYFLAVLFFILAIVAILIAFIMLEKVRNEKAELAIYIVGGYIILMLLGMAYEKLTMKIVGVLIQTNGGTSDLLVMRDKDKAKKLYETIAYYVVNRSLDKAISIDNSLNVTYGDSILGDKFSDIKNSNITNRSNIN